MTKFVEELFDDFTILQKGKIYKVIEKDNKEYIIYLDGKHKYSFPKYWFKEVEETNTFKFIPETEIHYATVNGVKGILIKE